MSKVGNYLKETKVEIKHVKWPTRREALLFTVAVIVLSIATALFLALFDLIFSTTLQKFIFSQ